MMALSGLQEIHERLHLIDHEREARVVRVRVITLRPFGVLRAVFASLFRVPRAFCVPVWCPQRIWHCFSVPQGFRVPFCVPRGFEILFGVPIALFCRPFAHVFWVCPSVILEGTLIVALKLFYFAFVMFAAFLCPSKA